MTKKTIWESFKKSLPVMAGYILLGIGFGVLLRDAGYGVLWALAICVLIYAGALQYVGGRAYRRMCRYHKYYSHLNSGQRTAFRTVAVKKFLRKHCKTGAES